MEELKIQPSFYFKHLEPSDAIQQYFFDKINKLKQILHHIESIDVRFEIFKENQYTEVTVHSDATVFHIKKSDKDLYASIDKTIASLYNQIDRYHKRIADKDEKKYHNLLMSTFQSNIQENITLHILDATIKPMDDKEAALQIISNRYKFLIYHHDNTKKYQLIFSRPDGNFSVIEPTETLGSYNEKIIALDESSTLQTISSGNPYPLLLLNVQEAIKKLQEMNLDYITFVNKSTKRMNILFHSRTGDLYLKRPKI